jgi:NMD protein affecting ribosome stability and mRNA decay
MRECRNCGANCDPGDLQQGLCEDCRGSEPEFRMLPKNTDARRQKIFEQMERNGVTWQVCMN